MAFKTYLYLQRYALAKEGAVKLYRESLRDQFLPEVDLTNLNWRRTKNLLDFAYNHVAYYRKKFDSIGLHPNDITQSDHFLQVPVLTRTEVINNFKDLIADNISSNSLKYSTTGGSTGTPLKIAMSKKGHREIQKWRMLSWWGLPPSVNMASAYRGVPKSFLQKTILSLVNWPSKVLPLDATQIDNHNLETFVGQYAKLKPELLHGYVGAVDALADYILERKINVPSPKVIWLTAAPVTKVQEEKISSAFNAPVCDQYGCSELYFISAECPHKKGLHIFADVCRLEILNSDNNPVQTGEYGKIVLTDLTNYAFPLIRYENGDASRLYEHKCSCGITLPLMDKVRGRISDNIVLPDGTVLAGEYLTTIFDDYTSEVKQFQLIQKKDGLLEMNVVLYDPSALSNQDAIKKVEQTMLRKINGKTRLIVNIKDSIQNTKGKLQFIVRESEF